MAAFRFIHTADVHLDSPMLGLSRYEGEAAERIRSATREAFTALIDKAIAEQVAFVIIAGDLYDGMWRDVRTGLYFSTQMGHLASASIPCFIVYGNHDAESQMTASLNLPDVVKVFPTRKAATFELPDLHVALHGQSFAKRDTTEDLVPGYPEPVHGAFNIGVLHTALTGLPGHANYAPCNLDELLAKGYQYWALGHIHHGQVLHQQPHIVFPGNLQGRSIKETGPKGAHLVTVEGGEVTDFATFYCDVVRWANLSVDVTGCEHVTDVLDRVRETLERSVADEADGRLLACRIELVGTTPLHDELTASHSRLSDEAKAAAVGVGADAAWVERVVVSTQPEARTATQAEAGSLAEVQGLLDDVAGDDELTRRLGDALSEFCSKLPSEVRNAAEDPLLRAAIDKNYPAVLCGTRPYLAGKLQEPTE